jgi:2,3-dihydroxybenzoate-AMP ligase
VARAGGVLAPLPVQWRDKDVGYVRELTASRFYVGVERFKDYAYLDLGRRVGFEQTVDLVEVGRWAQLQPDRERLAAIPVNPDDAFTLCWTSGTEAEPKGCPLTHRNWLFLGRMLQRTCDVRPADRILTVAPLVNMTAVGVNYIPWLLNAGTLLLHHPVNLDVLLRQLAEEHVHFTILVPAMLNMILKLPHVDQLDLSSIRTVATGSAPPSPWAMAEFKRRWGIEIVNIWGQNEGTGLVAGPADVPDLTWPSGVDGVEVKLIDDEGHEVETPGAVGELCYRGPGVFSGYFRRPDLTAKAFTADGFFRTGDLFVVHDARHLGYYDRKKDIVIRGGFNVSSAEVENAVQSHPKVAEAAVVPLPDEILGERVCVFVVPRDPKDPPTLEDVTAFLREQGMSIYKLPERLELIAALPRNPVGKIMKRALREELARRLDPTGP